jgi:hypothetical protein
VVELVVSGGQTGVDQAALRAAKAAGLRTGGWAARAWMTEAGPAPWLAGYGLTECLKGGYPARTSANIETADGTLILLDVPPPMATGGTALTIRFARESGKPWRPVVMAVPSALAFARGWLADPSLRTVNVAGPRESKAPGIGDCAEAFLRDLFTSIRGGQRP